MSQYQPPQQGFPQQPAQQPPSAGQASFPQQAQQFGQPGQASFPQQGQQFGQPGQAGFPQQQAFPQAPAEPGLFDMTFAKSTIEKTAKLAFIALIVVSGLLALAGLLLAIGSFSAAAALSQSGGGGGSVLTGVAFLLLFPSLGFALVTVGRLVIDHIVQSHKHRTSS